MLPQSKKATAFISVTSVLITVALLASFGLHAVQVAHEHPGQLHIVTAVDTNGHAHQSEPTAGQFDVLLLGEHMHLADKKLFLLVAMLGFLILVVPPTASEYVRQITIGRRVAQRCRSYLQSTTRQLHNHLRLCFSTGILHPKTH